MAEYVTHYNQVRLHSAVGYVTPQDRLAGHQATLAERDRKLAKARERRKQMRQTQHEPSAAAADTSRPALDFAAVRAAITMAQVLQLLGSEPTRPAPSSSGACPLHGSTAGTARCFSVNTEAHTFHCFKCGRSGNALDLWAIANRLSIYDAAVDLCQRLHIALPILPSTPSANREEAAVACGPETCTMKST